MPKFWLDSIQEELKGVTEAQKNSVEPKEEPGPKDHVVGVIDGKFCALFFLVEQNRKQVIKVATALKKRIEAGRDIDKEKFKAANELHTQVSTLKNIFWMSLSVAFPDLHGRTLLGIRKGWKVVWSDPEESELEPAIFVFGSMRGGNDISFN
ncbi:MAG: hypothetical protein NTY93_01595 [Candidatus Kaiserbacteria bacterium]|nr:hypothetical protein [Candidatus Kaiserbacteria bacterium]